MGRRVLQLALLFVSAIVTVAIVAVAPFIFDGARVFAAASSALADQPPHSCGGG
ncbi:MAG TPA: hypothetical protein VGG90_12970 [Candidatus Dormibacteraeota bacterium]|jgi:hypothetical protein